MNESYAIEIQNLRKSFDGFALQDVSLTLPQGCIMGLVGENGAGKSTTIKLMMNALRKDGGTVRVLGRDSESPEFSEVKEDIGVVLDEACFPLALNIRDVSLIMANTYARWNKARFDELVKQFNLPAKTPFKDFSRGMKMKLSIAVALSHEAKLLILDEPTGGLDPVVRGEILEIFYDFTRDPQHSILISSHIISDLEKLCDYIAFLHEGRLLFCEEKDALAERYGILHCEKSRLADVPAKGILGKSETPYGVSCLVKRESVNPAVPLEKASIEDIMVFLIKGEKEA